ncbi:MAG: cupin domain-containing protein, partial [Gammaproteobacteria bacterium]|nr:cupin domain-containing protein [Gammaproteobacteria bacterium]
ADPDVSIARARVEPGVTTAWHRLRDVTERYCILSGAGVAEIGDNPPQDVGPGDVVIIPPMQRQRITNSGKADLVFLAICNPRFTEACYESVG